MNSGRIWKRLRLFEAGEKTVEKELIELADRLEGARESDEGARRAAARWLRRLASSPTALRALVARKGRPRSKRALDMGLDYAIHRKLEQRAAVARAQVAKAWHVSEQTVADAFTDNRLEIESELAQLLQWAMTRKPGALDEEHALRTISADLRDIGSSERVRKK